MNVSKIRITVESSDGSKVEVDEIYDVVPYEVAYRLFNGLQSWRHNSDFLFEAQEIIDYLREAEKLTKEI